MDGLQKFLTEVFTVLESRPWQPLPPSTLVDRSDSGRSLIKRNLEIILAKYNLSDFLDKTSTARFRLILSDPVFSKLPSSHTQRLLRRIGYLCSLGHLTTRYKFWRITCPETIVFQSTEDADGRVQRYSRAVALLKYHTLNTKTPKADDIESAAQKTMSRFRKYLESDNGESCHITRYRALLRGRIRWSIIYIEHSFASYLKSLKRESVRVPANDGRTRFGENEQPMFESTTNAGLPEKSNWAKDKAEEAANSASESDSYTGLQTLQEHIKT